METEAEFDEALRAARKRTESFYLFNVKLAPLDRSPALHRLGQRLAQRV